MKLTASLRSLRARSRQLVAEYGLVALAVHFTVWSMALVVCCLAVRLGFDVGEGAAQGVGTLGAGWLLTQVMSPLRLLLTVSLTPVVGRRLRRSVPRLELR